MFQFYTVEITKDANGEFNHEVKWHWDADETKAQQKGESKFYEIMSRAAVSEYAEHGAILFSSEGFPVMNKCYKHDAAPEEPAEPEQPEEVTAE